MSFVPSIVERTDRSVRPRRRYRENLLATSAEREAKLQFRGEISAQKKAYIEHVELNAQGNDLGAFDFTEQLRLEIQYQVLAALSGTHCAIKMCTDNEVKIAFFDTDSEPELLWRRSAGVYTAVVDLPHRLLKPGRYFVNVGLGIPQGQIIDRVRSGCCVRNKPIGRIRRDHELRAAPPWDCRR